MNVLHVVPTYWPATRYGGPIYSVHGLCAALVDKGVAVTVFTTSVDGDANSDVQHGKSYNKDDVQIRYFESKYLRRIYFSKQLKRALEKSIKQFDLVHLHSIFLYPTNIAARIAHRNNIPYVVSPRGMLEKALIKTKSPIVKNMWLKVFEKRTLEQADLMHLTSSREKQELAAFNYSFPETIIIPNGMDVKPVNENVDARKPDIFQILFIGRLSWKKQIDKIIESLAFLNFSIKLIIAGNDEENYKAYLDTLISKLKINERKEITIDFVGEKHDEEKRNLFLNSHVMVLPSLSENFGNTVIESMAAGCPVIVTPEVGASEVVNKAQAGLMTSGTADDIAKQICYLKENPALAKQMSINGVNEIKKNYQWPDIADAMINAYQGLIKSNG